MLCLLCQGSWGSVRRLKERENKKDLQSYFLVTPMASFPLISLSSDLKELTGCPEIIYKTQFYILITLRTRECHS